MVDGSQALLLLGMLLFAYPFVIYPVLLRIFARRPSPAEIHAPLSDPPPIALVICALNEQNIIGQKLDNSLALDYPKDRLSIVIVSDGSTDRTAAIVRSYADRGVRLIERTERRGKVGNLNEVIPAQPEEIVVLSDANVIYDSTALKFLLAPFRDPEVGCVSGKVVLVQTTADLRAGEEDYYSVEWSMQDRASRLHSMVGADGAMYAIRRALFTVVPKDTLIEDFVVPVQVACAGKRVIFQPKAVGWETGPANLKEEFRRKVRIAAGAAQALLRGNGWPFGAPGRFWFLWTSHKFMRWLSPLFGLMVLATAAASFDHALSRVVLAGAAALVIAALIRAVTGWKHVTLDAPFYFLFGQTALLYGLIKGCLGKQSVMWAKANR